MAIHVGRFIPAGAGNTGVACNARRNRPVHPRRCGEHFSVAAVARSPVGSSPQVRGTPLGALLVGIRNRFIPAGAGNTLPDRPATGRRAVHPRRCGEHPKAVRVFSSSDGSSPQVRGTRARSTLATEYPRFIPAGAGNTFLPLDTLTHRHGSSPQVRGTPRCHRWRNARMRFIPAGAGNTSRPCRRRRSRAVHPRRCGEHIKRNRTTHHLGGSSPQVRGTRHWPGGRTRPGSVHPRRCGEHTLPLRVNGKS